MSNLAPMEHPWETAHLRIMFEWSCTKKAYPMISHQQQKKRNQIGSLIITEDLCLPSVTERNVMWRVM